jgi:hypothetical protein
MAFDRPTRADDDLHSNALSSLDADGLARLVPDPKVVAAAADGIEAPLERIGAVDPREDRHRDTRIQGLAGLHGDRQGVVLQRVEDAVNWKLAEKKSAAGRSH